MGTLYSEKDNLKGVLSKDPLASENIERMISKKLFVSRFEIDGNARTQPYLRRWSAYEQLSGKEGTGES